MRRVCSVLVAVLILLLGGSLLLTFILSARHAAARERCRGNLRHMGMALHTYENFNRRFPSGTKPKEDVSLERRLSWLFEIMPYIEARMDPDWHRVDWSGCWDDEANRPVVEGPARCYLCPSNPNEPAPNRPTFTHYVGIAGIGQDAALLPRDDPRAGIFGYENCPGQPSYRALGIRKEDIRDGLGTTMMVVETTFQNGPWAAGGPATVRGLDPERQPYLGENCQFGGLHRVGTNSSWFSYPQATNILFADASVRFVTSSIEPHIFEAMATIAGGERVDPIGE